MPNLGRMHCLRRITIDDGRNLHNTLNIPRLQCLESVIINLCPKLQDVTGIEDLEGSKCLHLFAGNKAVRTCIADLKRLPSEVTSVMVRESDGIEATLNASFFRDVIDNARGQIHIDENVIPHLLWDRLSKKASVTIPQYVFYSKLVTMRPYSTSIVCGVVESSSGVTFNWSSPKDDYFYPLMTYESLIDESNYFDGISGRIPRGKWIFIIVNTGQIQIELLCPSDSVSVIKLCKVTVYGEDTSRVLSMCRSIALATVSSREKWDVIDY